MKQSLLGNVICPECKDEELDTEIYASESESIEEGRLICRSCQTWYRIQHGILDLLPLSLRNEKRYKIFAQDHNIEFQQMNRPNGEEQKINQIEFFAKDFNDYEEQVTNSPYYMALDEVVFKDWIQRNLNSNHLVLDIGCGTGRQTFCLAENHMQVIGVDISEEMLLLARKKSKTLGLSEFTDFIVCDAENIPLKDQNFDACTMVGTLHHVSRPHIVIQNAARLLVKNGVTFSYDPHKSPVRFIFDFLMEILKLYDEDASDDPLFTEKQLSQLHQEADITTKTKISTYLPPHLFYLFKHRINVSILNFVDRIFNSIPSVRKLGGVVIVEGRKGETLQLNEK